MNRIFLILLLMLPGTVCYSQSDTDTQMDTLYIIDGVVTTNPINDSSKTIVPNTLLEEIVIYTGGFTGYNWYITHSIGLAPEESEPVFYVTLQTTNDNKILYGLKGGVYAHQKDLDEAVNEFLQSLGPLNAGSYSVQGNFAITRTPTYIGALSGGYNLNSQFTLDASFGFKYYRDDTYYGEINFSVPANGTPLPEGSVTPGMPFRVVQSKDIVRAYYSLGMNYRVGNFTKIGVFADNIYSFGANFSIEF